jgi:hypothetical protein
MLRKTLWTMLIALPLTIAQAKAQDSEDTKTRPNKQEIIDLMVKTGTMPAQQQKSKIDSIRQDPSAGKTPRSDFLFCLGLAYLDDYQAQRCVGSAYEHGAGIVEDLSEAYAWYAVALGNKITDESARGTIEADKERVKTRLLSAYPHPTEDDLDDMERAQKTRIAQYQEDAKKAKK